MENKISGRASYSHDSKEIHKHFTIITNKIETIGKNIKNGKFIEKYYEAEQELLSYIYSKDNNFNVNQIKFYKSIIREKLYDSYKSHDTENRMKAEKLI